ncbi:MAG: phosphoribosyltransferase [Candidatus Bathyarchaeum tardum]|nr:MAG: phosphoribosyltransferase [Candidatus Bathyarchaeum tardum]
MIKLTTDQTFEQKTMKESNNSLELDLQLEVVSWSQVYRSLVDIAKAVQRSSFVPDVIVAVSRGGLVPARILSDLLENSNLDTVTTQFYVGVNETKNKPTITKEISGSVAGKKVLLVDDLTDSGESLKLVISYLSSKGASMVKTAMLHRKPWSVIEPDYFRYETASWVVFPWDQKENVKRLFEKLQALGNTVKDIKEKLINLGLNKEVVNQISEEKN